MMKKKQSQIIKFFSLIEIMIVVGIAGVLLAISAPALTKMFTVQGTKAATITVKMTLERARSMAIRSNKPVAVVFLQNELTKDGSSSILRGEELAYRAVRICQVEETATSGTYDFTKWLDNWSELEKGNLLTQIIKTPADFKDATMSVYFDGSGSSGAPKPGDNDAYSAEIGSPTAPSVAEIVFTAKKANEPFKDLYPKKTNIMPKDNPTFGGNEVLTGIVFTSQGRTKGNYTLIINKATFVEGGTPEVVLMDKKAFGEFIYINKFTGRTKYGEIED